MDDQDLRERVAARCPDGTPIPSDEWIRLQFAPVCVSSCTALRYTGRLQSTAVTVAEAA